MANITCLTFAFLPINHSNNFHNRHGDRSNWQLWKRLRRRGTSVPSYWVVDRLRRSPVPSCVIRVNREILASNRNLNQRAIWGGDVASAIKTITNPGKRSVRHEIQWNSGVRVADGGIWRVRRRRNRNGQSWRVGWVGCSWRYCEINYLRNIAHAV